MVTVALAGGKPRTLASGETFPSDIGVDGASVYWTNQAGGTAMKVPLRGGSPITPALGQAPPDGIVWMVHASTGGTGIRAW